MAQKTDLNVIPYYDDFTESDNFQRVLFKPSKAVQARELTQLQSIMQNQIERFGQHVFKDGSQVIPGALNYDDEYYAVKLQSEYNSAAISSYLSSYVGKEITGATSGVKARVIDYAAATTTDPETLYVKYIASGTDFATHVFANGEDITADAVVGSYAADTVSATTLATDAAVTGAAVSVTEGVYFVRGMFVRVAAQTLILDKYTNTPNYRVGFDISETLVSDLDDTSLLDNAQGTSNFAAQGADRLKVILTLAKHTLTGTTDTNFLELMRLESGILKSHIRQPEYNEVMKMIARRTEEESGDYIVKPFAYEVKEHFDDGFNNGLYTASAAIPGDPTKFAVVCGPGKAYVSGYEVEKISSGVIEFNKARTSVSVDNETITADYGQYIPVTNVYGSPDITLNGSDTDPFKQIQLYNRQTSTRGSTSGTHVGNARVRAFEYASGTAGASATNTTSKYNLHLFDINMFTEITMSSNNTLTANALVTGATSGATGHVVAGITSGTTFTLQGVVGRFTTGESITSSVSGDTVAGTSSTVTVRNFNQDVKQVFMSYTVNAGEDFSADVDATEIFTMTGDFAFSENDLIGLEDGSGSLRQEDGSTNNSVLGDFIFGESVTDGTITSFSAELDEELVVNDVISLPTGDNGAQEKRRVTAITNNQISVDSAFNSTVTNTIMKRYRGKIQNPENSGSLLFPTSRVNVKTLQPSDTTHTIRRQYSGSSVVTASGGVLTFNAGSGETFVTHVEKDYTLQIDALGTGTSGITQGDIVSAGTGFVLSNSNQTLTITNTTLGTGTAVKFIATLNTTAATHKTKTRQKMAMVTVNKNASSSDVYGHRVEDLEISLGVADGYRTWAIYESSAIGTTPVTPTLAVTSQTGVFVDGEQLVGSVSGAKALVIDHTGSTVKIAYQTDAVFTAAEQVSGQTNSYTAQISSVTVGDPEIGYKFTFDSGQRHGFYDIARLIRKPNQAAPSGQLLIVFDYFTHGAGNFFSVDSYTNQTNYDQIPTMDTERLSDFLDFRPRVADISTTGSTAPFSFNNRNFEGTNSSQTNMPRPDDAMLADFSYYQGRCDYLMLTRNGKYAIVSGTPADRPVFPTNTLPDAMIVAALEIQPYTYSQDAISIQVPSHRRWTMKDITGLSKRVKQLERTVSLSLLEKKTENFRILDAEGLDRFKTGFLVDPFTDHTVGHTDHPDYAGSVDRERGEFRPGLEVQTVELMEENTTDDERTADGYVKKGDMGMLPYTDEVMNQHSNKFATRQENLNPFSVTHWNGVVTLDPESDLWIDTNRQAAFSVNVEGDWQAWQSWLGKDENGQPRWTRDVWKAWQTDSVNVGVSESSSSEGGTSVTRGKLRRDPNWRNPDGSGAQGNLIAVLQDVTTSTNITTTTRKTTTVTQNQSRTGERFDLDTFRQARSTGDETTMEVIPWMRERDITVTATNLKPNTRMYAFFNERDVTDFTRPTGVSQATTKLTANVTKTATTISVTSTTGFPDSGLLTIATNVEPTAGDRTFDAGDLTPSSADQHRWSDSSGTTYVNSETMVYSSKTATTFTISTRGANGSTAMEHKSYTDPDPNSSTYNTTIFPTISDSVSGQPLITDSLGQLECVFKIPNTDAIRFPTGRGVFRLTDSASNSRIVGTLETSGEAVYTAFGQKQIKQERFNNLRNGRIIRTDLGTQNRSVSGAHTSVDVSSTSSSSTVTEFHGWGDPLAQTIRIEDPEFMDDGVFLTKIDVYFAQKDTSTNPKPVQLQLRPVVNGYPAWEAIPGAQITLPASSINTSDDASVTTSFTFDWPIHLRSFTEYAIVLISTSLDYRIWISRLGEVDVGGTSAVTEQPYLGSLFKSQNASAWTASQFEDLKFTLHRAKFTTGTTANVYMVNKELTRDAGHVAVSDGRTRYLAKNPLETYTGSNKVKVKFYNHGMHSNLNNVEIRDVTSEISDTTLNESAELSAADTTITVTSATNFASAGFIKIDDEVIQYTGKSGNDLTGCTRGIGSTTATTHEDGSVVQYYVFAGIPLTEINKVHTSISGVEMDSFEITTSTNASKTFTGGGKKALITKNVTMDTMYPKIKVMEFPDAQCTAKAQVTTGMSLGSSQTPFTRTASADSFEVPLYDNYIFTKPYVICSKINETNELSGNKSFRINAQLTTTKDSISPVVDMGTGQMGIIAIANRINKIDSSSDVGTITTSTSTFKDSKQPKGDGNTAIYITKEIKLKQEATAIKTIFDASVQSEASLEVYYKIANSNSETPFEELGWVPFNTTGVPDLTVPTSLHINDFLEYEYTAGKNDDITTTTLPLEGFSSFAIKIVMKSLNSSKPPILRDFRTLALAE